MRFDRRKAAKAAACGIAVLLLLAGVLIVVLQSAWFRGQVRDYLVRTVEQSTGGRVDLAGFDFKWQSFTAQFTGLKIHGSEPQDAAPLFAARNIVVQLRIVSLLERDVRLRSIAVSQPVVHILVRPDGTTNVPTPPSKSSELTDTPEYLTRLAIARIDLNDGAFYLDHRRRDFDLHGSDFSADLRYRKGPRQAYLGRLSLKNARFRGSGLPPIQCSAEAAFEAGSRELSVEHFAFQSQDNRLEGSGRVTDFRHPHGQFHMTGALNAEQMARSLGLHLTVAGQLRVNGSADFEHGTTAFRGTASSHDLTVAENGYRIRGIELQTGVTADPSSLRLPGLRLRSPGGSFSGELTLQRYRELQVTGDWSGVNVRRFASLVTKKELPFSSTARGTLRLTSNLDNLKKTTRMDITAALFPIAGGMPLGGTVNMAYDGSSGGISLKDSHLQSQELTLSANGALFRSLSVSLTATSLTPLRSLVSIWFDNQPLPSDLAMEHGNLTFEGTVVGAQAAPSLSGHLAAQNLSYRGLPVEQLAAAVSLDTNGVGIQSLLLSSQGGTLSGAGTLAWDRGSVTKSSQFTLRANGKRLNGRLFAVLLPSTLALGSQGEIDFAADLSGSLARPVGSLSLDGKNLAVAGQPVDAGVLRTSIFSDHVSIDNLHLSRQASSLDATGTYTAQQTGAGDFWWKNGLLDVTAKSTGIALAHLSGYPGLPALPGTVRGEVRGKAAISQTTLAVRSLDGAVQIANLQLANGDRGALNANIRTESGVARAQLEGQLASNLLRGDATVSLSGDYKAQGQLGFHRMPVQSLAAITPRVANLPVAGQFTGNVTFSGPLTTPQAFEADLHLEQLLLIPQSPETGAIVLRSEGPIDISYRNGAALFKSFNLSGADTHINLAGTTGFNPDSPLDLAVKGSVKLSLLTLFLPEVDSDGRTVLDARVGGTVSRPALSGTLQLADGSFYVSGLTSGVDHANALIRFDQDRATIQQFTAQTGGGNLSASGFMTFGGVSPFTFRLSSHLSNVRLRYSGLSTTMDGDLRYTGSAESSLLSGAITVTKAVFAPQTDVANLVTSQATQLVKSQSAQAGYLGRTRLDVAIQSSSTLELTTSLSQDVQAEIDLRLRGTADRPALLGRVAATEGQIQFFGSKYNISRGEVDFFNPLKIEPVLDLDLETRARGVTVNITINGTPEKLNMSYRSDPPLQSSEIIALLATGRTPDSLPGAAGGRTTSNRGFVSVSGGNSLLGSALSPNSGRLQRFFGITHLKIDPLLSGVGIVPQARLTMEQQLSKQITVTYITNLSRTAEQIFRVEWAFDPQYSLVAIRDENGLFGVDIQYRRRFK